MSETVKLEIEIPKPTWDALIWYMKHTPHYISRDTELEAAAAYINQMIRQYLRMEADNPTDATDNIKAEMGNLIQHL